MMFAMARCSDGFGDERYLAYLTFQVAVGATIAAPVVFNLGDGQEIELVRFNPDTIPMYRPNYRPRVKFRRESPTVEALRRTTMLQLNDEVLCYRVTEF